MSELRFRRILVDSRYRSTGTPSNFTYDLPVPVELPPDTTCYISDVIVGNHYWTVEEGYNDNITVTVVTSSGTSTADHQLDPGIYTSQTIGEHIAVKLTAPWGGSLHFQAQYNDLKNQSTITSSQGTWSFNVGSPHNCDHTLGLNALNLDSTMSQVLHPDIRGKTEQILICGNVGRAETLGPKGPLNCLCRVPITVQHGKIMHYENHHPSERIAVGHQMLSRLHFRITDIAGNEVNGRGNISFSLLFE
jgi:hypothetical protein